MGGRGQPERMGIFHSWTWGEQWGWSGRERGHKIETVNSPTVTFALFLPASTASKGMGGMGSSQAGEMICATFNHAAYTIEVVHEVTCRALPLDSFSIKILILPAR